MYIVKLDQDTDWLNLTLKVEFELTSDIKYLCLSQYFSYQKNKLNIH